MHIIPLGNTHLEAAAALLAQRHQVARQHVPELPAHYEDVTAMVAALKEALPALDAGAVAALDGDRLVGVLGGRYLRPEPDSFYALVVPPRTARVSELLCAAAEGMEEAYRLMYAALSERWVTAGYSVHVAEAPAWDGAATAAWCSLGFGQQAVRGLRDLGPPAPIAAAGIEIREAGPEDIAEVARLAAGLARYHAGSPIFLPFIPEAAAGAVSVARQRLASEEHACFLALRDEQTLGYMQFTPAPAGAPGVFERTAYLDEAFTDAVVRSGGAGTALLAHGLAWARERGYTRCSVNWISANLVASRFWLGHGFRPVRLRLLRRIDERIAWAHGDM
jgi:GNAT superfamily N-acetyltransferase